jgi:LPS sulfotransferase NodH
MMFRLKKDEDGGLRQANRIAAFFDKEHYRNLESLGFINKLSDILESTLFAEQLRVYVDRIVSLRRNNVLKQAVSSINAQRMFSLTGKTHAYSTHEIPNAFEIDIRLLDRSIERFNACVARQERFIADLGLPIFELTYESVVTKERETLNELCEYLSISKEHIGSIAASTLMKQTNSNLRVALRNFDELCEHYRGTKYLDMLKDTGP